MSQGVTIKGKTAAGQNVPVKVDSQGRLLGVDADLTVLVDEVSATLSYIGKAIPGSLTSAPLWQIKRLDETTGMITTFADGNAEFDNIWDDRASLSYS